MSRNPINAAIGTIRLSYFMKSSRSRSRSKNTRNRSTNNGGGGGNVVNRVFDSSGPEGKVRGTPQQIIDKYNQLARDAQLSGDRVATENFQQHAEHYLRMLAEAPNATVRPSVTASATSVRNANRTAARTTTATTGQATRAGKSSLRRAASLSPM